MKGYWGVLGTHGQERSFAGADYVRDSGDRKGGEDLGERVECFKCILWANGDSFFLFSRRLKQIQVRNPTVSSFASQMMF